MEYKAKRFVEAIKKNFEKDNIIFDSELFEEYTNNTLGFKRNIIGVVFPKNKWEVIKIVDLANQFRVSLYPISRGKNTGYGDKTPIKDNCFIVDLSNMNKITEFDNINGFVRVESGVTQEQLYNFLKKSKSNFWMDVTGSFIDSSIVGCSLDGGLGHSPKGNRRKIISDIEIVLGNGRIFRTGEFPGLGPDLAGMFVQSNFGIITSLKIELIPIPEYFESFVISIYEDKNLESLIDSINKLKNSGTINSTVHLANAMRTLVTINKFPKGYSKNQILTNEDAIDIINNPLIKIGYWNALGGLYGTKKEVKLKKKIIKKNLMSIGKVRYFSDKKINLLRWIVNLLPDKESNILKKRVESLKHFHGFLKGEPNNEPTRNIYWRETNKQNLGLLMFCPVIKSDGKEVRKVLDISERIYKKYRFEMPLTLNFADSGKLIGVFSIHFNKEILDENKKALDLYNQLSSILESSGIYRYRTNIINSSLIKYKYGKEEVLKSIKKTLDPNNIISPGRYGI